MLASNVYSSILDQSADNAELDALDKKFVKNFQHFYSISEELTEKIGVYIAAILKFKHQLPAKHKAKTCRGREIKPLFEPKLLFLTY